MSPEELFVSQCRSWFSSVFGGNRVSQGSLLDPFATSLRRTGVMVDRLQQVRVNGVPGGDANQVVTDLAGAGLVERRIGSSGSPVAGEANLTTLGAKVLDEWVSLGVADSLDSHEIARGVVLIRVGLDLEHPTYVGLFHFWQQLTSRRPAQYWLQDGWHMYAPSYLNQYDDAGFNPFSIILALNDGGVWTREEWANWASSDRDMAPYLDKFIDRVPESRLEGRRSFCRAMELYRLYTTGYERNELESVLMGWRTA